MIGDKFLSPDNNLKEIVLDLFNGSSGKYADSLIEDATNLGLDNGFIALSWISSNPWSRIWGDST